MDRSSAEIPVSSSSLTMHSLASTFFCCQDITSIKAQLTEIKLSAKHQKLIESFIAEATHILNKGYPRVKKGLRKPDSFSYVIEVTTRVPYNGYPKTQLKPNQPCRWFVLIDEKLVTSKRFATTKARKTKKVENTKEYDERKCVERPNYGSTQQNWIEIKSVDVPKEFTGSSEKNKRYLRYACQIQGHDEEWSIRVIESSTPKRRRNKINKKKVKRNMLKANPTITTPQPVVSNEISNRTFSQKWEESEFMADDESSDGTDDLRSEEFGQDKRCNYSSFKSELIMLTVENVNMKALASIGRGRSASTNKNEQLSDEKETSSKTKAKISLELVLQSIESSSFKEQVMKKTAVEEESKKKRKAGRGKSAGGSDEEYKEEKPGNRREVEKDPKGKGKRRKNSKEDKRKAMPEDRAWGARFHYPRNIF